MPEVFEEMMASALRTLSIRANSCCLILRSLYDDLDNPVALFQLLEIVFQVAGGDPHGVVFGVEQRRLCLCCALQAHGDDSVSGLVILLLFLFQVERNDVEQEHVDACSGEERSDAASHDSRPDNRGLLDFPDHYTLLCFVFIVFEQVKCESKFNLYVK